METLRYNAFTYIHKALRALLYDAALTIQQTDFTDPAGSALAVKKIEQVLEQFESHAAHEDRHIIPAVMKYDPGLASEIDSEHEKDEMLTLRLENKITKFLKADSPTDLHRTGLQVMYCFIDFVAFNLTHMNKEESMINKVLWENYTDEELMDISKAIRTEIPPQEMMLTLRLMLKGISNAEIVALFNDMKANAPAPAYEAVRQMAILELPSYRWHQVSRDTEEATLLQQAV